MWPRTSWTSNQESFSNNLLGDIGEQNKEFIKNLEVEKSTKYLSKLKKSGIDNIYFAWIGSYEPHKEHYYIIHSPDFIIEYDNKSGNHIHAIWREKGNDFGEDILKSHYSK